LLHSSINSSISSPSTPPTAASGPLSATSSLQAPDGLGHQHDDAQERRQQLRLAWLARGLARGRG
jgi:hypothetical protein